MGTLGRKIKGLFSGEKEQRDSSTFDSGELSEISQPYNFAHEIHVGFNPTTKRIEGVPEPWLHLLKSQGVTEEIQKQNPDAVLTALKFYVKNIREQTEPAEHQKFLVQQSEISQSDEEILKEDLEHLSPVHELVPDLPPKQAPSVVEERQSELSGEHDVPSASRAPKTPSSDEDHAPIPDSILQEPVNDTVSPQEDVPEKLPSSPPHVGEPVFHAPPPPTEAPDVPSPPCQEAPPQKPLPPVPEARKTKARPPVPPKPRHLKDLPIRGSLTSSVTTTGSTPSPPQQSPHSPKMTNGSIPPPPSETASEQAPSVPPHSNGGSAASTPHSDKSPQVNGAPFSADSLESAPVFRPKSKEKALSPERKMTDEEIINQIAKICSPEEQKSMYKLIEKIGHGASGQVFTAEHVENRGKFAIKCMDLKLQPKKELLLFQSQRAGLHRGARGE